MSSLSLQLALLIYLFLVLAALLFGFDSLSIAPIEAFGGFGGLAIVINAIFNALGVLSSNQKEEEL